MLWSRGLTFIAALALMTASAKGFQETMPSAVAPAPAGDVDESPLGLAPEEDGKGGAGTSIGPSSLDFGLELLYGSRPAAPATGSPDEGDVGLSGRLKHSF
jgi:hypothetical protein